MENNDVPLSPARAPFPIVGMGASAGGLVALEQFLSHVPLNSGMAYVIVQHLDPHREGMLVELLQRHTPMPIAQAQDQMQVEADHIYVIPPGHDLAVRQGTLHLLQPPEPRGLRLPIDFFFKSLADDRQQHSIGVILSGMGSDGTLGLRAIRQAAGACFVQTPAEAQFDSMPRSAIDAGVADVVAPAHELPGKILAYVARIELGAHAETEAEVSQKDAGFLDKVILLLRTQTGHDFSLYKKSTISRRVERRMGLHQLGRLGDYLRYLRENPQESELLFNELLIGVTSFFRDAAVWEQLKTEVIPALLANHPDGVALRAWVPGCSTGEEAYSLAMVFKEALDDAKPTGRFSLQIFASDLDKEAIATGRAGVYPRSIATEVSEKRLNRFFVEDVGGYRICNEIREMVVFAEQNIIVDPPFTKLDILSCRNLLIYLEAELQTKLIQLFHYSLNVRGFLVLGSAESIGTATALFSSSPGKTRIYRRLDVPARMLPAGFPAAFVHAHAKSVDGATDGVAGGFSSVPNLQLLVDRMVLQQYAPSAVLVTDEGDILYVSGKTGKYLEPATGKASLNLFAMAREGLKQALSEAFHRAIREKTVAAIKKVKVASDGSPQYVDVVVQPLEQPAALRGMALVVFNDVVTPRPRRPRSKAAELSRASNDMKNLLDSTEIATLFLDDALNVRRFTVQTGRIIKLISGDMGRPITDIVTDLNYPEMAQDAREVLRTLVFRERDVPTNDGRWFRVRTMPYRTQENRIDGLVTTFSDITVSKKLEAELRATQARLQALMEHATPQGVADGLL